MNNFTAAYRQLIQDTITHVEQSFENKKSILVSQESCDFFRSFNKKNIDAVRLQQQTAKHPSELKKAPPLITTPQTAQETEKKPSISTPNIHVSIQVDETTNRPTIQSSSSSQNKPQKTIEFSDEIKKKIEKVLPHVKIVREIPSDEEAQRLSEAWKQPTKNAQFIILSFSEGTNEETFLMNVKRALDANFGPCSLIDASSLENKKEWDLFFSMHKPQMYICSSELFRYKQLISFYKENTASKERFLHSQPLLLLSSLSNYLSSPEQKRILWNHLCAIMKKNL
jgi:hypothetical protein